MAKSKKQEERATREDYAEFLEQERDLEGLVLRGHMLLERELVALLAVRLRVPRRDLPARITFELLARLALSGSTHEQLLDLVVRFNKIRNSMAHEFRYGTLRPDAAAWAARLEEINSWFDFAAERLERRLQESVARLCYEIVQVSIATLTAQKRGSIAQAEVLDRQLRQIGEPQEEIDRLVDATEAMNDDDDDDTPPS